MEKWEYKYIWIEKEKEDEWIDIVNELGNDGWQCVQVFMAQRTNGRHRILSKRRVVVRGYKTESSDSNCNLAGVNGSLSIDYLVNVLKRTLTGNDEVRVEFDNKEDNINYVLDICNNFKKELEKDCK